LYPNILLHQREYTCRGLEERGIIVLMSYDIAQEKLLEVRQRHSNAILESGLGHAVFRTLQLEDAAGIFIVRRARVPDIAVQEIAAYKRMQDDLDTFFGVASRASVLAVEYLQPQTRPDNMEPINYRYVATRIPELNAPKATIVSPATAEITNQNAELVDMLADELEQKRYTLQLDPLQLVRGDPFVIEGEIYVR
jgi:hypothetical protein